MLHSTICPSSNSINVMLTILVTAVAFSQQPFTQKHEHNCRMRTKRSTAEPPSGGRPTKRQRAMLAHRCTGEPLSEANTPHTMKTRTRNDSSTLKKSSGSIHMSLPKEQAPEKISKDPSSTHDVRLTKRQRALRAPIPVPLSRGDLRYTDRISGPNLGDTLAGHYEYDIGDNLTPRCTYHSTQQCSKTLLVVVLSNRTLYHIVYKNFFICFICFICLIYYCGHHTTCIDLRSQNHENNGRRHVWEGSRVLGSEARRLCCYKDNSKCTKIP